MNSSYLLNSSVVTFNFGDHILDILKFPVHSSILGAHVDIANVIIET